MSRSNQGIVCTSRGQHWIVLSAIAAMMGVLLFADSSLAGGRRNIIQHNASFDTRDGDGTYQEPRSWRAKWPGDGTDNWWWTITSGDRYTSYNGTCGWGCDHDGKLGIRMNRNENLLIAQDGCNGGSSNEGKMSKLWNDSGTTRLVAKVWRKTCRNNTWVGWIESDSEWGCSGTNKLGENTSDNAEGDQEHKDWMANSSTKWVGGAVGVHEGGYDSNGRLTMFDDYWLSFEVAATYSNRDVPTELWAGQSQTGRRITLDSFGWDNFGSRTGDWRMKTNNDDANKILRNTTGGNGTSCQTSVTASGDLGNFFFTVYGYGAPAGDANQSYSPEVYFRREGGNDVDCVKWDDNPDNRQRQLRVSFPITVKGHQPAIQALAATQIDSSTVRLGFNGYDRKGDTVSYTGLKYRLGAGGVWTNANCGAPSSNAFSAASPAITVNWNAAADLGGASRNDVYFQVTVSDGVYTSSAQTGPFTVSFDSTPPTVQVTHTVASPTNANPIAFTITFDENVTGLTAGELVVTNGTAALSGSGAVYTADVTPAGDGEVTLTVPAGVAQDSGGNNNTASNTDSVVYDGTAPSVAVSHVGPDLINGGTITFNIEFDEPVVGFGSSIIVVTNGTKGAFDGSGASYTLEVIPSDQGAVTCQVPAAAAQDQAGNSNTASNTDTVTLDSVAPGCTVSYSGASPATTTPIVFAIEFNEDVTGLIADDVVVTNGTKGLLTGSGAAYSIEVMPDADGDVTCSVPAGAAEDGAGNANTASNTASVLYDAAVPTVTVEQAAAQADPTNALPIVFNVQFSEPVTGFDSDDVIMVGTAGGISFNVDGSGASYTIEVSNVNTEGTVVPTIPAGSAVDIAGQGNTASTSVDNSVTFLNQPSPVILGWASVHSHTGQGAVAIALDPNKGSTDTGANGPSVECRREGIAMITVEFSMAVQAADGTLDSNDVVVTDSHGSFYTPSALTLSNGDTVLSIEFTPMLPDMARYTFDLAGKFTSAAGLAIAGDADCQIRGLVGDLNSDGAVNLIDLAVSKNRNRSAWSVGNACYDVNRDGALDLIDAAIVRRATLNTAP